MFSAKIERNVILSKVKAVNEVIQTKKYGIVRKNKTHIIYNTFYAFISEIMQYPVSLKTNANLQDIYHVNPTNWKREANV